MALPPSPPIRLELTEWERDTLVELLQEEVAALNDEPSTTLSETISSLYNKTLATYPPLPRRN